MNSKTTTTIHKQEERPLSGERAVVLLSGGQDSTTCLYWARARFKKVYAIGFNYGQKHLLELELAQYHADKTHTPLYIAPITTLGEISPNALTNDQMAIEATADNTPPNTMVEGRNLLFLTYAAIYAKSQGVETLVIGVGEADYSHYPDCRNEFIRSAEASLSLAMDYPFHIEAPLMWKTKAETWALADQLGVLEEIKKKTLTCYNGIPSEGCGTCPACLLRQRGLHEYTRQAAQR